MTQAFFNYIITLYLSLCIGILFRKYKQRLTVPLFAAAIILPLISVSGRQLLSLMLVNCNSYFFVLLFCGVICWEISQSFYAKSCCPIFAVAGLEVPVTWLLYGSGVMVL
jgi:FtsH-binding integral membrane protein